MFRHGPHVERHVRRQALELWSETFDVRAVAVDVDGSGEVNRLVLTAMEQRDVVPER